MPRTYNGAMPSEPATLPTDVARDDDDLRRILALQRRNLARNLGPEEAAREGFVTLTHDLALLREMGARHPHVVGRRGAEVVAYALVMPLEFRPRVPELEPMFEHLAGARVAGRAVLDARFYVMGQVCVAREERGRGWVDALYAAHARRMAPDFDLAVTEVDADNPRSLRVHRRTGWIEVARYDVPDGKRWIVLVLILGPAGVH